MGITGGAEPRREPTINFMPENDDIQQPTPTALASATGSAAAWLVEVWVCGNYGGFYEHETEEQAEADAAQRRKDFGILGCRSGVCLSRTQIDLP